MALSQVGAVPKNQLDALPLYTASQATVGGTISVGVAGGFTRLFSPAVLGISAVNFAADANGFNVLVSNFIDVTGCRSFSLILTRTNAGVGIVLAAIDVRMQFRLTDTDVPPTSLGAISNIDFTGSSSVNTASITFPAMQAGGEVQRALKAWDLAEIVGFAGTGGMMGNQVRLYLSIGSGALPAAGNLFSATLWGAS